jgi:hypothetical protein
MCPLVKYLVSNGLEVVGVAIYNDVVEGGSNVDVAALLTLCMWWQVISDKKTTHGHSER